jgi:ABC-type dipeptide/oligopeptide/nickel transport system ATPase component
MFNVEIHNISVLSADAFVTIIDTCSLKIEPGKTYILFGSNGSGKSTLTMALTDLLNKNIYRVEGSVIFKETDLLNCSRTVLNEIRQRDIKYVFQDPVNTFNPLKKFDYYFQSIDSTVREINEMLEFFLLPSIEKLKNLLPHEVSVGMAQRIAIALAFLAKPQLIIMDEPNSALDLASSNLLLGKIKEFNAKGTSLLIITQDTLFAQKAGDEIALLSDKTVSPMVKNSEFFK